MRKALLMAPAGLTLERFCAVNTEVLRELNYEVHLAANFSSETEEQDESIRRYLNEAEQNNFIVHQIGFERHSLVRNLEAAKDFRELLEKERFDLIHAHTETGGLLLRLSFSKAFGAKLIFTPHGMSFYKGSSLKSQIVYRPIEHWICKKCDAVISINQEEKQELERWNKKTVRFTHGAGVNFAVVQNDSVQQKRNEFGIPETAILVTSIGELNQNKNQSVCIRAISKIERTDIYYLICGVGELRERLLQEAEKAGVGNRIILPGFRRDIPDILACTDIFAFPSYHEGLSAALMEAMSAGLPVVCSRIRGNTDLIDEGMGGYLFYPNDSVGFAKAILELADNRELRKSMGSYNMETVKSFSKEIVKGELTDVYSSVERKK